MDEFIQDKCEELYQDCTDFDDAMSYIDEVVDEVMSEYNVEYMQVRNKCEKILKQLYSE